MDWLLILSLGLLLAAFLALVYAVVSSLKQKEEKNLLEEISKNILEDELKTQVFLKDDKNQAITLPSLAEIQIAQPGVKKLKDELAKVIVGQDEFVNSLLIWIVANHHVLVEGVPGLAKTKTVESIARLLDLDFKRVQFTPDMLPADITWTQIFNMKTQKFETQKWPVFTNILLADEINRTTPKVQSALLEAMQERKVHIGGQEYLLPEPFFVLATQNPIEQEWTYPLPEAQIDRFMLKVLVDYPPMEEEMKVLDVVDVQPEDLEPVVSKKELLGWQEEVREVAVPDEVKKYIVLLVRATRLPNDYVALGASPRGAIALMLGAKAVAWLEGRQVASKQDVDRVLLAWLRHRLILTPQAEVDWVSADDLLKQIAAVVPDKV